MLDGIDRESDLYLLYTNTGTAYDISIYEGEPRLPFYGYKTENAGVDPLSGVSHKCEKLYDDCIATVTLSDVADPNKATISLKQMKSLYCDDCIHRILTKVRGFPPQVLIVDPQQDLLYPIRYGTYSTTHYKFKIKGRKDTVLVEITPK